MPAQDIVVFHCNDSWIDREICLSNSSQIICSASILFFFFSSRQTYKKLQRAPKISKLITWKRKENVIDFDSLLHAERSVSI